MKNEDKMKTDDDAVTRPAHYGGEENLYEPIKIIESLGLDFHVGNALKYILRAGRKTQDQTSDLKKAIWYLQRKLVVISKK